MRKWQSAINPMVGGGSVVTEGDQVIAFVPRRRSYDGFEISGSDITNARLIAAVPALLEALRMATRSVECDSICKRTGKELPWHKAALLAIHKAEGTNNEN